MNIDILVITTNIENRLHLLENTILSIERADSTLFKNKILSVDMFSNQANLEFFDKFKKIGWQVISGEHVSIRGMVENQRRGLSLVESEFVLYCEDDIVINKFPKLISLEVIKDKIGFICYNTHLHSDPNQVPNFKLNFIKNSLNYLIVDKDCFLIKTPEIKDDYYLNFPVSIIRTGCFKAIHSIIDTECRGLGIEIAMTKGWFYLEFDKMYNTMIFLNEDAIHTKPNNSQDLHNMANMKFYNNDAGLRHPSIENRKNSLV